MGLLILVLIDSEYEAGDLGPLRVPEILRQWALPYLVGRFFLGTRKDLQTLRPLICLAVLAISLYGIFEAVVRINPLVAAFGQQFGFLDAPEGQRWGLKRAQGLLNHPIYFGYALALFLPWVFEARRAALGGEGPTWWRYLPWVTFACLFVTGSRAAIFIGGLCAVSPWLLEIGRRKPISFAALFVAVAVLICCDDRFLGGGLNQLAGEEETTMLIRGEEVQYSGTNHRLLLFTAFGPSLSDLGLFGMGSQLQGLDTEGVPETFVSMDSHYLRFSLQHGYLAIGLFVVLAGLTFAGLACRARESRFDAHLCGAMAGITFMLFTVCRRRISAARLAVLRRAGGQPRRPRADLQTERIAEPVALASEPEPTSSFLRRLWSDPWRSPRPPRPNCMTRLRDRTRFRRVFAAPSRRSVG